MRRLGCRRSSVALRQWSGTVSVLLGLLVAGCRSAADSAQPRPIPSAAEKQGDTAGTRPPRAAPSQTPLDSIKANLSGASEQDRNRLLQHLDEQAGATAKTLAALSKVPASEIESRLVVNVARNLEDKAREVDSRGARLSLSPDELRRTVIDYECFKLETFTTSGVFPKRYFGYFDEKWDTAPYEQVLRETVHASVAIANEFLRERDSAVRLTDAEIAVTFIAEGGALLLREKQQELENIHPIYGIGLDDIATGFSKYKDLVSRLDARLGTRLADVVVWQGGQPLLNRYFRFREAIAGTALMYVYEKEIASRKLKEAGRTPLSDLPLRDQFIVGSLVYNSGNPHDAERLRMIATFSTADYLWRVSEKNRSRRALLNVLPANLSIPELLQLGDYPEQATSWNAVYHILQRYGAYVALKRFTDVFDGGDMFAKSGGPAIVSPGERTPQPAGPDRGARLQYRGN